jgi:V/A-type H+-transporting ATPase subunit I
MFGMMFGDLGHGGILFLAGLALRLWPHLRESYRRNGTILASVGASAMAFGVLYGSLFGYENIIPALWFRPMTRINQLLMYAVLIGIGIILFGILVNIVVKLVQRRYLEVIFERFGVLGLWFYLGALFMVYMTMKGSSFSIWLAFVLMFLPLVLMPLERPLARRAKQGKKNAGEEGEPLLVTTLVTAVDLFETMIVYLSNSISFVRVAAFALNHVALSLAIFQLGGMLRGLPGGGALYVLAVAGGNLMILLLEGGIVGIQALRLEFYEFFSKFFEPEGTPFRPFQFVFSKKEVDRA